MQKAYHPNRIKCKKWYHAHAKERSAYSREQKAKFLANNQCPICKQHSQLEKGFKRCLACRQKGWLHEHGIKIPQGASLVDIYQMIKTYRNDQNGRLIQTPTKLGGITC